LPEFLLTPARETKLEDGKTRYDLQLFYRDWTTNEIQAVYLQSMNTDFTLNRMFPQWKPLPSEDMIVNYPLLAYRL